MVDLAMEGRDGYALLVKPKTVVLLSLAVWSALSGCVAGALLGWASGRLLHTPQLDTLPDQNMAAATRLFSSDGVELGSFATERRIELRPEQIPTHLKLAIVAAEDANFYRHGPLELKSVLRAVLGSITTGRLGGRGGGSTITQQLALNLFLQREISISRKAREALLAIDLEKRYSKDQILTMYANIMYLGKGVWGVEAASRLYFNLPASALNLAQAATLAGMIPSPDNKFSATSQPSEALRRRNWVLKRMYELEFISEDDYQIAVESPLDVAVYRQPGSSGAYFQERARLWIKERYDTDTLYRGGLQVQVTMDPVLQRAAEEAVREGLVALDMRLGFRKPVNLLADGTVEEPAQLEQHQDSSWHYLELQPNAMVKALVTEVGANQARLRIGPYRATLDREGAAWTGTRIMSRLLEVGDLVLVRLPEELPQDLRDRTTISGTSDNAAPPVIPVSLLQEPELEAALLAIDSSSGAVLAEVGGFDFRRSEFNRAVQAKRQCGSTFKPFVALTAFEQGYTPADTLFDAPFLLSGGQGALTYCPKNFYPKYFGITTLRQAIEHSYNASAVKLQQLVGGEAVIDTARRFGITSELQPYPSMALGSFEVSLLELVRAYAGIANLGEIPEPYFVERVLDRNDKLLYQGYPSSERAMSAPVSYLMQHVLRGVVERGTGKALADLDLQVAGKTGTTDSYTDAWFVGFSPRITVGVWVGRELSEPIGPHMSGAAAALPIWKRFIEAYLETLGPEQRAEHLPVPPGVVHVAVDHFTGKRALPTGPEVILEAFLNGTEPVESCNEELHKLAELPWPMQLPYYTPKRDEPMPTPEAIKVADARLAPQLGIQLPDIQLPEE